MRFVDAFQSGIFCCKDCNCLRCKPVTLQHFDNQREETEKQTTQTVVNVTDDGVIVSSLSLSSIVDTVTSDAGSVSNVIVYELVAPSLMLIVDLEMDTVADKQKQC